MSELKVAVLGAGIVGLTTILELKKEFRNASLDLIADKFYDETTSFVAAGHFLPANGTFGNTEDITRKWIRDSFIYWDNIRQCMEAPVIGVKEISGFLLASQNPFLVRNKYLYGVAPIYRPATEEELGICPGNWKYGSYISTLLIDPNRYLKWALEKVEDFGIGITRERIDSFAELNQNYDVIVNCTGLGGRLLCGDDKIVALRGQVAKVEAPWIKNFFYADHDTYVIPSFDNVTLGGCRQYESYNTKFNKYDHLAMTERCQNLVPSLRNAKLLGHRVGLRPHRVPVRVEKDYVILDGNVVRIVHNYGHGGYGVTTAPGTALNAVDLVKEVLVERKSKL